MAGKFEVYRDKRGKYRFRLKAGNGAIIAVGEAYESKAAVMGGIESIRSNALAAALVDLTDAPAAVPAAARSQAQPQSQPQSQAHPQAQGASPSAPRPQPMGQPQHMQGSQPHMQSPSPSAPPQR